jgi:Asp-tRNA(Asn)/Glu-tRNA(Gln) amidotransferase B subunit
VPGVQLTLKSKALQKQLTDAMSRNPKETTRALMDCVLDLAGKSAVLAPIETGDLRNDCHGSVNGVTVFAEQAVKSLSAVSNLNSLGKVSYSLPYALKQHEDLTLRHDRTDGKPRADGRSVNRVAGGQAKFLQQPFEQSERRYINRFARIPNEVIQ